MGYIEFNIGSLSGGTCSKPLEITWTKVGREYMIGKKAGRKKGLKITYFSLNDNDIDYNNNKKSLAGFIGSNSGVDGRCINGTMVTEQKNLIKAKGEGDVVNDWLITLSYNDIFKVTKPMDSLVYDIFINDSSIFDTKPVLTELFYLNTEALTPAFFDARVNTLKSYINPLYRNKVKIKILGDSVNMSSINNYLINSQTIQDLYNLVLTTENPSYTFSDLLNISIKGQFLYKVVFEINGLNSENIITDNEEDIKTIDDKFNSSLIFTQRIIPLPESITEINYSGTYVPSCSESIDSCAEYYGISALSGVVLVSDIEDCLVGNFDGWVEP